jgi:spermidine/putrescine transport system substrate-binding protein
MRLFRQAAHRSGFSNQSGSCVPFWLTRCIGVFGAAIIPVLVSCKKTTLIDQTPYEVTVRSIDHLPAKIEKPAEVLRVLCWNDYFPEKLFEAFEGIYGIRIEVDTFENNEELIALFRATPDRWDLIMPSDYVVSQLIQRDEILPIDRALLPRLEDLSPTMFELECDPGLKYFVPIFYSSLGLSFDVHHVGGFPRHWDFVDQQRKNPFIYGRIALPDQMRVAFAMALLRLGLDPNTTQALEIAQAEAYLTSLVRDFGASIVGDEILDPEVLRRFIMILTWNGTGAFILLQEGNYRFLIPEERTILAVDGFVLPKNSTEAPSAYLFLNFLLNPQILAMLSDYSFYAPSSLLAQRYVSSFILNGPSIMKPDGAKRLFLKDVGDAAKHYEASWARVKATLPNPDLTTIPLQRFK